MDELLKGCERPEHLLGDSGLMRNLKKALMQRMLGAELTEHLRYEHGQEPPLVQTNRRNGVSRKTLKSEDGMLDIEVPRDREGSWMPRPTCFCLPWWAPESAFTREAGLGGRWLTGGDWPLLRLCSCRCRDALVED